MKTEVYKVVRIKPKEKRVSACCSSHITETVYPVGEVVVPKIGKLFAFSSLRAAKEFAKDIFGELSPEVWKAKGTSVKRPDFPFFSTSMSMLKSAKFLAYFWGGEFTKAHSLLECVVYASARAKPPTGTVLCSSITLLERVDKE